MPRLVYIVSHPMTARALLRGQLSFMRERGFDVTLICSPAPALRKIAARERVEVVPIAIEREIAPMADARALATLRGALRSLRPGVVNASTPKAGLLGMLAARAAGVPRRIYVLRGLRGERATGGRRRLLDASERVAAACAHQVVCVSESLRQRYVARGLAPGGKTVVLGAGSSNGVDADRFAVSVEQRKAGRAQRAALGLSPGAFVFGFVGRLTRDKGIEDLERAFSQLVPGRAQLLLVGAVEHGDALPPDVLTRLRQHPSIAVTGDVPDPRPYYQMMDAVVFPSYREGFPNVPLEAAASGLPVVGYRATGTVDAVVDGTTGTLVPVGDWSALAEAMDRYAGDGTLAARHGDAARQRAVQDFRPEAIWQALAELYAALPR